MGFVIAEQSETYDTLSCTYKIAARCVRLRAGDCEGRNRSRLGGPMVTFTLYLVFC